MESQQIKSVHKHNFQICNVLGCDNPISTAFRCKEHWKCDCCGSTESPCYYGLEDGVLCQKCRDAQIAQRIQSFHGRTDYQRLITCPWCGWIYNDSWERNQSDGETLECGDCGKEFVLHVIVDVCYTTEKTGQ